MDMRDPQLGDEIRRLDDLARSQPERFKASHRKAIVRAIAWLVLCQLAPVVLVLGGVAGLLWQDGYWVADSLIIIAGAWLTLKVWRCVELKVPEIPTLTLDRRLYALLFKDINEIRRSIGAPKFQRITFTMELNASVTQRPRLFGLLGSSSRLYIGFPLIFCFSREEFRTVLAHELAHVSRRHCLSLRLISRVQCSLMNLRGAFGGYRQETPTGIVKCFDKIMRSPTAHFVAAHRLHEREADMIAAGVCGAEACARALGKISLLSRIHAEEFLESLRDRVRSSSFPDVSMLEEFLKFVERAGRNPAELREQMRVELLRVTDLTDSHPSLAERLATIGVSWTGDVSLAGGAAADYFGREFNKLREQLDALWVREILPEWRERHHTLRDLEKRMTTVTQAQPEGGMLHGYELLSIASWGETLYGDRHGLEAYASYHAKHPQVLEGRFHYGRLLLANRDPHGLEVLRPLVETEPVFRETGLLLIKAFHERVGEPEKVREACEQLEAFYRDRDAVIDDRLKYRSLDVFHPHEMPAAFQDSVYRLCGRIEGIQRLYLLRKEVKFYTQSPFFVMVICFNSKAGSPEQRSELADVLRYMVELPGDCIVVDVAEHFRLRRRLKKKLAAAKIYDRDDG